MLEVKFSLLNYNKFVNFIGNEWVENEYMNYLKNGSSKHPFILQHSSIINSQRFQKDILPKEIYLKILLEPYLKYSFLGSITDKIDDSIISRLISFKKDLQNPNKFNAISFEILTMGILLNSNYKIKKVAEVHNKGNPEFIVLDQNDNIISTVECSIRTIPEIVNLQEELPDELANLISDFIHKQDFNCQIYLSTSFSYREHKNNLFLLVKEVITNQKTGWTKYCEGNVIIYFHITSFSKNQIHKIDDYSKAHILLLELPSNLHYDMIMESCGVISTNIDTVMNSLHNVKNISEIALNYELGSKDIHRAIRSTALNKTEIPNKNGIPRNKQFIEGVPHHVFIHVPNSITSQYQIDYEKLKEEISSLFESTRKVTSFVLIDEHFGKDENDIWTESIIPYIYSNPNAENKHDLKLLNSRDWKVYTVTDEENQIFE